MSTRDRPDAVPIGASRHSPWTLDFVSPRVSNYEYNPEQGILLDRLWVK